MFYYLGIDIAGYKNTWAVVLSLEKKEIYLKTILSLKNPLKPNSVSLKDIVNFCQNNKVLAVAIDAPLSFSIESEKGIRNSDKVLRDLLPSEAKTWVVSYNALMAIPIRAYLLAQTIAPYCGTIIETHPRASFYFSLPNNKKTLAFIYKKVNLNKEKKFLINWLESKFDLCLSFDFKVTEGILDAILCGVTGYFYHRYPEKLLFLPEKSNLKGFGPFVVIYF
ncbi:DUF429 domain-containing protein [Thermodesulfobacterium hydrogeniphilum]|uniref:DUF429 domain-containing protein n=1 Tax=Thermodesulfobacterium hydrogeniphilum TaxID=161156 RepID=UPI00056EF17C|nr:DUF429 domain-containing protein [Thermodesulfobacterium hydrogeniphilum]